MEHESRTLSQSEMLQVATDRFIGMGGKIVNRNHRGGQVFEVSSFGTFHAANSQVSLNAGIYSYDVSTRS